MMIVDQELLDHTKQTEKAVQDGIVWLQAPQNVERIGEAVQSIERELKRGVVEARRLSEAVVRPMAVAVFGASQAGKSYLISVLARHEGDLLAEFDGLDKPVSYIRDINIDNRTESTGLVTRFTINKEATPAGFPVCLRWLSHTDLIKILANSYYFDGRPNDFPESGEIADHVQHFAGRAGAPQNNGLTQEDIWDLQDYFNHYMTASPLTKKLDGFWSAAGRVCPNLGIDDLGGFLSILWGKEAAITKLYRDMVGALQQLGFPKTAYVPFSSIDGTRDDLTSIICVAGLTGLAGGSVETIEVRTTSGASATLSRAMVAALTAEIVITIKHKPWPFFDHTDLLDFPGYRSRGLKTADITEGSDDDSPTGITKSLAENPDKTLQTLLLRGKVEYLFQRYMVDQEITSMLLCAQPNNLEVDQLPQVIANWIAVTHGARPEERVGKPEQLFFVLTKFDSYFERKANDSDKSIQDSLESSVHTPLIKSYGANKDSWVLNWTPGKPFNNCYLMRNPTLLKRDIFEIDGDREVGVGADAKDFVETLKSAFLRAESPLQHIKDPERAFEAMMALNDGGASYIAENLAPVCDPKLKQEQIKFRLQRLKNGLYQRLASYYVSSDSSVRLDERLAVADTVLQELYVCDERMRFGSLLRGLMLDPGVLASRLHEASLSRVVESKGDDADSDSMAAVSSVASQRPRPGMGRVRPRPMAAGASNPVDTSDASVSQAVSKAPAKNRQRLLAEAAIVTMIETIFAQSDNPNLAALTGVSNDALREIAKEITLAVRRVDLTNVLAEQISRIAFVDRRDELLNKASLAAEHIVNGFIADLGNSLVPEEKRAVIEYETGSLPVFKARETAHDASGITDEPDAFTTRYVDSWLHAFFKVVQDNALGDMQDVDPEINARLGSILERLKS